MSALAAAIASRAPSLGRGGLRWLNLGLLLGAAGLAAVAYVVVGSTPAASNATIQQTSTVTRGVVLSSVSATGSVVAAKNLSLNFQSGGTLTEVDVKAGEHVAKGQVLGKIDSTAAAAGLRQAQAALASARANLQTAMTGETAAQRRQDALSVATARASLANAEATAKADVKTADAAVAQAEQQLRADRGNEAVAVAQKKTDLGSYTDLAAAEAAATAAQATVNADQVTQHTHQQTQLDLQTQQTVANQQLAADKGSTAAENSDQATLNSIGLQLQAIAKTLANDSYQLSQDQAALSTIQSTVNAAKADVGSIQGYEAKIVSDTNAIASAKTNRATTVARDKQSVASARLSVTSSALGVAVKQAPPTASTIAQLQSAIVQAETNLATAQRTLDQTTLRAPIGGTVAAVNGIVGQTAAGGGVSAVSSSSSSSGSGSSTPGFVTLIGLSSLEVTAPFAESDAAKLAVGDPATVTVAALGTTELAAHVASIDATGTSSSGVVQYGVTFALDATSTKIKAGMTANVSVTVSERDNVLHVPSAAVTGSGQNARVTVLKNGKSQVVPVVAGLKGDSSTEIVSGLTAGQTVVTSVARAATSGSSSSTPSGAFSRGGFGKGLGGGGGPVFVGPGG